MTVKAQTIDGITAPYHAWEFLPGEVVNGKVTQAGAERVARVTHAPVVPETNPAPILGSLFLFGAIGWEIRRRSKGKLTQEA